MVRRLRRRWNRRRRDRDRDDDGPLVVRAPAKVIVEAREDDEKDDDADDLSEVAGGTARALWSWRGGRG